MLASEDARVWVEVGKKFSLDTQSSYRKHLGSKHLFGSVSCHEGAWAIVSSRAP